MTLHTGYIKNALTIPRAALAISAKKIIVIVSDTHDALVSFVTDLGVRSGETAIISIRRAALAIRAKQVLIARA